MLRRVSAFAFVLLAFLAIHTSLAADTWPVPRGPSREMDPYVYKTEHLKNAPKAFLEDASACIVYYGATHLVQADGTTESIVHEITRLNGRKGIENLGEYRGITFDPSYQKMVLNVARVIKPDGKTEEVHPKNLQLRDSNASGLSYETTKELVISFPNLEIGDLYEVKWTIIGQHPENQGHFFRQYLFGSPNYPVVRESFSARLPKSKKLKYALRNGQAKAHIRTQGKHRLYRWSITNHSPLPQDGDLPSKESLRLQLMCSTFQSWDEVGKWKQQLRQDCWECTPKIARIVQKLTKGIKSPEGKAKVLTHWVRKKIRYVSVVSSKHRYRPRKPAAVLSNLYGDCKDQAQLLAVMLREAGLQVHLVTLGMLGDGQVVQKVPSPWGTHAILLVRINGIDHWIDTTNSMTGWDFLPRADRDRVCYVTDEHGKTEVLDTPSAHAYENRIEQLTEVMVQPDGTSLCRRNVKYHGFAAIDQRDVWIDTPIGECRRKMAVKLQDSHSRSQLLSLSIDKERLLELDEPVLASVVYRIPGHFSGKSSMEASFTDGNVWSYLLAYNPSFGRDADMHLWMPSESVHRYVLQLPPSHQFQTNPWEDVALSKWGSFHVGVKRDKKDPRRLEIRFHLRIDNPHIHASDFPAFRKFHQKVMNQWRVWITIAPTTAIADALALETMLAGNPGDLHTAKILAGLYLENQRPRDAQRVVHQALVHHPDEKSLWDLAIQSTTTWAEEEAVYHQMVRRFPYELRYPLAMAKACLNQNKHDKAQEILGALTESETDRIRGEAYYYLAKNQMELEHPAKALNYLKLAKLAYPASVENVHALRFQGQVFEKLGQPGHALAAYELALQIDPHAEEILAPFIRLQLASKKTHEVLPWLRKYSLAVQGDVSGLNRAARFHLQMNRLDDAYDLAMQARDITFSSDTQEIIGLVCFRRGNFKKAVFHLDRAYMHSHVLEHLIRGHLALGNVSQAMEYAVKAGQVKSPGKKLARLVTQTASIAQRKNDLIQSLQIPPGKHSIWSNAVDHFVCAEFAYRTNAGAGLVDAQLKKSLTNVTLGQALALRALLSLENGRLRDAKKDIDWAIKMCPKEARVYYVRGRIRFESFQKGALSDLETAVKLSHGKEALMLHWLAAMQFEAGMHKEAVANQKIAAELLPQNGEIQQQLIRIQQNMKKQQ